MQEWEHKLAFRSTDRVVRPFDWGLEWANGWPFQVSETDPETALRLSRAAARLRGVTEDALPREPRPGVAYIHVEPRRIISWDYSRDADAT